LEAGSIPLIRWYWASLHSSLYWVDKEKIGNYSISEGSSDDEKTDTVADMHSQASSSDSDCDHQSGAAITTAKLAEDQIIEEQAKLAKVEVDLTIVQWRMNHWWRRNNSKEHYTKRKNRDNKLQIIHCRSRHHWIVATIYAD